MGKNKGHGHAVAKGNGGPPKPPERRPRASRMRWHLAAPVVAAVCFYFVWNHAGNKVPAPSAPTTEVSDELPKPAAAVARQEEAEEAELVQDNHTDCRAWASTGECDRNPAFMLSTCKASCSNRKEDRKPEPPDDQPLPDGWTEYKAPDGRPYYSNGGPSQWERPTGPSSASSAGAAPRDSWHTPSECIAWAGGGECEANQQFMSSNCAGSCHKILAAREAYKTRCRRPEGLGQALPSGAYMNETFARIMADFGELEPEMIADDPPVLLFHNFLTVPEADAFIKHGQGKYAESRGVGVDKDGKMTDVKTEIRTSSHTWCQESPCIDDPLVQGVLSRISDVSRTPEVNGEFAQLVYYRACPKADDPSCAFYRRHSDYIDGDQHRVQGVRIYTLFMYLNDVEEGGGTRFTDLPSGPVTFQPKRGKAILWPSVLADDPHKIDPRTHHEALPVTKGEKYGANIWIHQYDFKAAHRTGCTMG